MFNFAGPTLALFLPLALWLAWLIWWIVVVVEIGRKQTRDTTTQTLWVLIVTAFPVLGIVLWYAMGRRILEGTSTAQ